MTKEELEKEAGDYADKHAFRVPYDGSNKFYDDVDFKASKEGYIAGAEPREKIIANLEELNKNQEESLRITLLEEENKAKRIKDLEKENAEIIKNYQVSRLYLEGYDDAKKKAEKEISELKEQNIKDCENFNKTMKEIKEQWNKEHYQLIKAKELLNDFLLMTKIEHLKERYETVSEAEQFLKESE